MTTIPFIYWAGSAVAILALLSLFYFFLCQKKCEKI
jgi:hypothetical protein